MKTYAASLDITSKIITVVVSGILLVLVATVWLDPADDGKGIGPQIFTTMLTAAILTVGFSFSPTRFALEEKGIRIRRFWSDVFIPYDRIRSAKKLEKIPGKGLIRTMGSGGFFGYYGYFRNDEIGDMKWYVTHRKNVILVEIGNEKILLSPDDEDDFLNSLEARIQV